MLANFSPRVHPPAENLGTTKMDFSHSLYHEGAFLLEKITLRTNRKSQGIRPDSWWLIDFEKICMFFYQ